MAFTQGKQKRNLEPKCYGDDHVVCDDGGDKMVMLMVGYWGGHDDDDGGDGDYEGNGDGDCGGDVNNDGGGSYDQVDGVDKDAHGYHGGRGQHEPIRYKGSDEVVMVMILAMVADVVMVRWWR